MWEATLDYEPARALVERIYKAWKSKDESADVAIQAADDALCLEAFDATRTHAYRLKLPTIGDVSPLEPVVLALDTLAHALKIPHEPKEPVRLQIGGGEARIVCGRTRGIVKVRSLKPAEIMAPRGAWLHYSNLTPGVRAEASAIKKLLGYVSKECDVGERVIVTRNADEIGMIGEDGAVEIEGETARTLMQASVLARIFDLLEPLAVILHVDSGKPLVLVQHEFMALAAPMVEEA